MTERVHCVVYRSPRREDLYLYVTGDEVLGNLPAELLEAFGPPVRVLELELTPDRRLAREDPVTVMASLAARGFHLQLPAAGKDRP
jgi:uncharacterized protein YcgL (UPF0745 family)